MLDLAQVPVAQSLLAKHDRELDLAQKAKKNLVGLIKARCEECGRTSEFEARDAGTLQVCPHCNAYVDVPELTGEPPTPAGTRAPLDQE